MSKTKEKCKILLYTVSKEALLKLMDEHYGCEELQNLILRANNRRYDVLLLKLEAMAGLKR